MHKLFCCYVLHKGVNNKRQLGVWWIRLFQPTLSHRFMSFWLHAVGSALEIDRLHSVCHDAIAVSWGPMHLDRWCLSCFNVCVWWNPFYSMPVTSHKTSLPFYSLWITKPVRKVQVILIWLLHILMFCHGLH